MDLQSTSRAHGSCDSSLYHSSLCNTGHLHHLGGQRNLDLTNEPESIVAGLQDLHLYYMWSVMSVFGHVTDY